MPESAQEVLVASPQACRMDDVSHDKKLCSNSPATVIIFDWDDTLLASTFLSGKGYRLDAIIERCEETDAQLKELEISVNKVLTTAMRYGDVIVITNAETGWVELSAQKFIPGVVPLLSQLKVVSARSTFEEAHPDCPLKWKYYAFQEGLSSVFSDVGREKNIISFGDSHVEREAVRLVTRNVPLTFTKSVKFAERPSMDQLRRQIELVTNCFHYIHSHNGDLDLQLTVMSHPPESFPEGAVDGSAPLTPPPMEEEENELVTPDADMNQDCEDVDEVSSDSSDSSEFGGESS